MSHGVSQHLKPRPIEMQQLAVQLQREIRRPRPVLPVPPIAEALAVVQEREQLDHVFPRPVDPRHRQRSQRYAIPAALRPSRHLSVPAFTRPDETFSLVVWNSRVHPPHPRPVRYSVNAQPLEPELRP
jgi:hypothetical protein